MSAVGNLTLGIVISASLFAQAAPGPQFEVASIRAAPPLAPRHVKIGLHIDGAQVRGISMSLKEYLGIAYRLKVSQISGPDWIASERFDISATLPEGARESQVPEMLQALLADRFQLKAHKDKKDFPVYVLLPGKGPLKLQEAPPDSEADKDEPKGTINIAAAGAGAGVGVNLGHGASFSLSNNRFEARKLTMKELAGNLERFADRPIVDETGLAGRYDFALEFTPEDYRAMLIRGAVSAGMELPPHAMRALDGSSEAALDDALKQIGLRVEARKAPLDVLVVDEAQKIPADN